MMRRRRPSLHFVPARGWINDPYGVVWDGMGYHVFYQAVPDSLVWAPACSWGHAASPDLVHWRECEPALLPADFERGCWSGSAVVTSEQAPAVLFYTRVGAADWQLGQVARADFEPATGSWTSQAGDVIVDGPPHGLDVCVFRDPYVWRSGERSWRMLVGAGTTDGTAAALQYSSEDLRSWRFDTVVAARHTDDDVDVWTGAMWECPQLIAIDDRWVLVVSVWSEDVTHYVAAAVGAYVGRVFTASRWQRLTYGRSAYAMSLFADSAGSPCAISWLREESPYDSDQVDYAGAHSLVSALQLADGGVRLQPHPAVSSARVDASTWAGLDTSSALWFEFGGQDGLIVEVGDHDDMRVRVSQQSAGLVIERPQQDDEVIPGPRAGAGQLILDADILEIFAAHGYGAYRLRQDRSDDQVVRIGEHVRAGRMR